MSDLNTPEIAAAFGALDDDAIRDGAASHAYVMRRLAITANRLVTRGHPVWNVAFDADPSTDTAATGDLKVFVPPFWIPVTRALRIFKKPGLNKYELSVILRFSPTDDEVRFQLSTRAAPFDASAADDAPNMLSCVSTGSSDLYTLEDIPADVAGEDLVQLWLRGMPTEREMDTGVCGGVSTGDCAEGTNHYAFRSGAGEDPWNTTGATPVSRGHYVQFLKSAGVPIGPARILIRMEGDHQIAFWPQLTPEESAQVVPGATTGAASFVIKELPRVRLLSRTLWTADREG